MSKEYTFSENLQKIHAEAESVISSHLQKLDRISNDIKALESVLSRAAIPFKFTYIFKKSSSTRGGYKEKIWALEWNRKRLMYTEIEFPDEFFCNPFTNLVPIEETIPLIEAKSNIRMALDNELPVFYKEIIDSLKRRSDESAITVNSPFLTDASGIDISKNSTSVEEEVVPF